MAHIHSVYDTDSHFIVDPDTRAMKNVSESKITIVQYDHNSERITFELPRYVDGHDMSTCNDVKVHYTNKDAVKKYEDAYEVSDLRVSPEDENVVICSWLISKYATRLAGTLQFSIHFVCMTGSTIDYAWCTLPCTLNVSKGICNTNTIIEQNGDLLEQWRQTLAFAVWGSVSFFQDFTGSMVLTTDLTYAEVTDAISEGKHCFLLDTDGTMFAYAGKVSVQGEECYKFSKLETGTNEITESYYTLNSRGGLEMGINTTLLAPITDEDSDVSGGQHTVYCWGDSLTEGVGGWLATPEGIQQTIVSAYPDVVARSYPCVNLGCRGETIQTIMARQGADPMVVGDFTIPASASDDVVVGYLRGGYFDDNRLGITTASGDLAQPLKETEAGINPCLIAGVEGELYRDMVADSEGRYAYRFRRLADGEAVTVGAGTQIETYAMRYYRNGVAVIWMGANGAVSSHTAYIQKLQQMIEYGNYSNYLVVVAREYTAQWVLEDANSIKKAFTDTDGVCHLLYLPPELIRRGYTLAGIAGSAGVPDTSGWTNTTDEIKLAAPLLMYSGSGAAESNFETLHFSSYGYKAIGKLVVEKLGQIIGMSTSSGSGGSTGGSTGGGTGGGSTDKGYVTNGTDDYGDYAYKLTRPMTGVGNVVDTGVQLYNTEKDWTIAVRFKDDMVVTDGSLGCVFELREWFPEPSKQTASHLRISPQADGTTQYIFAAAFAGFAFPFDNCTGYVEPTDGYHTAVIAKNGVNYEFYFDGGLAYGCTLNYELSEECMTDETLYLFGRVENGNALNTVTGVIDDFRIYNAYFNKTVVTNLIAAMAE